MPKKPEIDLTLSGALEAMSDFFFDIEKTVEKASENEPVVREPDSGSDDATKPTNKRVGNTFVAKKAGAKVERRTSSDGPADVGGKTEPDDGKDESKE